MHWEVGIYSTESGNQVVLVRPDCSFCRITSMDMGRDTLECNLVFGKCILYVLGAFIVQDVEGWDFTLCLEGGEDVYPCISDAGTSTIINGPGMDRVGIIMIQYEYVLGSAGGSDRESTCLVIVRL